MSKLLMIFATVLTVTGANAACNLEGKNMQYNGTNLSDVTTSDPTNYYNQVRNTSSIEVSVPGKQRYKK